MKKRWFTISNISNVLLIVFLLAMVLIPDVKAWTIRGLMKIGLFQPGIPETSVRSGGSASSLLNGLVFEDQQGNIKDLAVQKDKVVFINFWATWCPPCIAEMPAIQQLYNTFKDDDRVVFVMADMDDNPRKAQAFMEKKGLDLPVYTPASRIPDALYTGTLPTTVILDRSGKLAYRHEGAADYASPKMTAFIRRLLETPDGP